MEKLYPVSRDIILFNLNVLWDETVEYGINENFNMMAKARIAQYGYIPNPDPWRDLNE